MGATGSESAPTILRKLVWPFHLLDRYADSISFLCGLDARKLLSKASGKSIRSLMKLVIFFVSSFLSSLIALLLHLLSTPLWLSSISKSVKLHWFAVKSKGRESWQSLVLLFRKIKTFLAQTRPPPRVSFLSWIYCSHSRARGLGEYFAWGCSSFGRIWDDSAIWITLFPSQVSFLWYPHPYLLFLSFFTLLSQYNLIAKFWAKEWRHGQWRSSMTISLNCFRLKLFLSMDKVRVSSFCQFSSSFSSSYKSHQLINRS